MAELSGAVAALFRVDRAPARLTVRADLEAAGRSPRVDRLTFDFANSAPGDYTLTVTIIDRVSAERVSRRSVFTIAR